MAAQGHLAGAQNVDGSLGLGQAHLVYSGLGGTEGSHDVQVHEAAVTEALRVVGALDPFPFTDPLVNLADALQQGSRIPARSAKAAAMGAGSGGRRAGGRGPGAFPAT